MVKKQFQIVQSNKRGITIKESNNRKYTEPNVRSCLSLLITLPFPEVISITFGSISFQSFSEYLHDIYIYIYIFEMCKWAHSICIALQIALCMQDFCMSDNRVCLIRVIVIHST